MHKWAKNSICAGLIYNCWLAGSHKSLLSMCHFSILQFNLICAQKNKTFSDIQGGKKTYRIKESATSCSIRTQFRETAGCRIHSLYLRTHWPGWPSHWRLLLWRASPRPSCPLDASQLRAQPAWWACNPPCSVDSRYTPLKWRSDGPSWKKQKRRKSFMSSLIYWWYLHSLPLSPECTVFSGQPMQK